VKVTFAGSPVELGGLKVVMDHWSQAWGPGLDEGTELSKILFLPQTFVFFFFLAFVMLSLLFLGGGCGCGCGCGVLHFARPTPPPA
jgi:hypothetical protein